MLAPVLGPRHRDGALAALLLLLATSPWLIAIGASVRETASLVWVVVLWVSTTLAMGMAHELSGRRKRRES